VDVLIYQGEDRIAFNNTLIGKLPIPLPEPKPGGYWKFAVTFGLDNDGLLKVIVKRLNDDQSFRADVQCAVRSSRAHIEEGATHLAQVMAVPEVPPPPPPPSPVPAAARREAAAVPAADAGAPAPAAGPPVSAAVSSPPPETTPEEFRSIARRSYKLLQQPMDAAKQQRLRTAYDKFVAAVAAGGGAGVEDLGDELGDAYLECKPS
jgi:molecular chaperone DnaK (HSP70)